jgi:hypothetical protein
MPPNITHVSSASASPMLSAPRSRSSLCLIRHDRLAERCIRRGKHRRQQCQLQGRERGEHDSGGDKAEHDCQRQTDQQQPLREPEVAPDDTEIRVGGVGEQDHGQRHFGQDAQPLAAYVDADHAQAIRAEDKANPGEHDRAADPGSLDPAGERAVDEKKRG